MRIKYSPWRDDITIAYEFGVDKVTASIAGQSDVFDFSALPDGKSESITSTLSPCPVLSAERVSGELTVTLLKPYGANATELDRFPPDEVI